LNFLVSTRGASLSRAQLMVTLYATNCIELSKRKQAATGYWIDVGNVKMQSLVLRKQGEDNPHIRGQVIQICIASRRTIPASNPLQLIFKAPATKNRKSPVRLGFSVFQRIRKIGIQKIPILVSSCIRLLDNTFQRQGARVHQNFARQFSDRMYRP
jgi:predicted ThiF/HesA family dinucleotide-utilizing enzyme